MTRLFRGLRAQPPRPSYDVVLIGSGIGGLVCANLLARAGMSVLLVEQHYMAGGYCSIFRRGGYTFDASTHFYPLLGNPETMTGRLLAELGVRTRWARMDPVDVFHFPDGSKFAVPVDLPTYLARVKGRFPDQAEALDAFFGAVREAYGLGLLAHFRERPVPQLAKFADWSVRDALERFIPDPRLRLLLTADCPHWGSPPGRTSFVFDSMLRLSYFLGNYYPIGGSQAFADELARTLEAAGGHILMSTTARRIRVVDGRAVGVDVETTRGALRGQRSIAAAHVVSNADMLVTLEQLLAEAPLPPELLARVRSLRLSFPCFLTHLGLRGIAAADLEAVQGYYWNGWDPESVGRDALACKIFAPTLYDPGLAPAGGHVVILQKVLEMDPGAVTDWDAHRAQVEAFVVGQFAKVLPGIENHIVVRASATARTAERFTLNRGGAMLGWEMAPDQLGSRRPGIDGVFDGLFFVGHWTTPGGGVTPVIVSAMQVADRILSGSSGRAVTAALGGHRSSSGIALRPTW